MRVIIDLPDVLYYYLQSQRYDKHLDQQFEYQSRDIIRNGIPLTTDVISKDDTIEKIKYGINNKACFGSPLIDWAVIKFIQGLPSITDDKNDSE